MENETVFTAFWGLHFLLFDAESFSLSVLSAE
jgi:hypothetical protein